jgi:hypothetical protein
MRSMRGLRAALGRHGALALATRLLTQVARQADCSGFTAHTPVYWGKV